MVIVAGGAGQGYIWNSDLEYKTDRRWIFTSKESLSFYVQACKEVHFFVSTIPFTVNSQPCGEVIIGTNENQEIMLRPDRPYDFHTTYSSTVRNLLDCDKPRKFWISWDGGMLRAGRGDVYEDELISAAHKLENTSAVGTTAAEGVDAMWTFGRHEGKVILYTRPPLSDDPFRPVVMILKFILAQIE